jgi:hypothetical protein
MLHPLSNSKYLLGLHFLLQCELENAVLVSLVSACEADSTDTQCRLCSIFRQEQTQILTAFRET